MGFPTWEMGLLGTRGHWFLVLWVLGPLGSWLEPFRGVHGPFSFLVCRGGSVVGLGCVLLFLVVDFDEDHESYVIV